MRGVRIRRAHERVGLGRQRDVRAESSGRRRKAGSSAQPKLPEHYEPFGNLTPRPAP